MRFTKLVVESFQTIKSATVEFGSGLNILYGPNDLGKSTLGTAIRAALLVPPSSAEALTFTPWYADASPQVSLTFVDGSGHHWRVKKGFGDLKSAELSHSKDGLTFTLDCKARQVEEKLRGLLDWGIPPPGGKGAPRGLPHSFLSNVLLGAQTDVDGILKQSLGEDPTNSGKLRLTKALATLAQDPMFKQALDAAQSEVDKGFTPKGHRKSGQNSPFTLASVAVKKLQEEVGVLKQQLNESSSVEANVVAARERYGNALAAVDEAQRALASSRQGLEATRARLAAQARLGEAQAALSKIAAQATRLKELEGDVRDLEIAAKVLEGKFTKAESACEEGAQRLRKAEEAHRLAAGEDGARQRELKRAQLGELVSGLRVTAQEKEARKAAVLAAIQSLDSAKAAARVAEGLQADVAKLKDELVQLRDEEARTAAESGLAHAVLAYGRWKQASSAAEEAAKAVAAANAKHRLAGEKRAEAEKLEAEIGVTRKQLAARQSVLPSEEGLKSLQMLERDLEVAEASLGGGFSVVVHGRGKTRLTAVVDGKASSGELPAEAVIDAERTVRLSVADQFDIEVTAGALEKRKAVEQLRLRWQGQAQPLLERAGAQSVSQVVEAQAAVERDLRAVDAGNRRAEALQLEAKNLLSETALLDQAGQKAPDEKELAAKKAAVGSVDPALLQEQFNRLGKAWEAQANKLIDTKAKSLAHIKGRAVEAGQAATLVEYKHSEAVQAAKEREALAAVALAALGSGDAAALLSAVNEELSAVAKQRDGIAAQLAALEAEGSVEIERAVKAVSAATQALRAAEALRTKAAADLGAARAKFHARTGERDAFRAQLQAMDRAAAESLVAQRNLELTALPAGPEVSTDDVQASEIKLQQAQGQLDQAKQDLYTSEGALSKVGGAAVREEVARLEEAVEVARAREKELEIDADAWMLLRDTLRSVENDEGAHLGRALAQPVTKKFRELTGGRYEGLKLDPELKAEGLDVAGASVSEGDVISVLSVGTRDQLATLIRLTIAEQLKSAIVLDDHLVHTDPVRLAWFRDVLLKASLDAQVLVLTCRPRDYLEAADIADGKLAMHDVAGGTIRALNMERLLERWGPALSAAV